MLNLNLLKILNIKSMESKIINIMDSQYLLKFDLIFLIYNHQKNVIFYHKFYNMVIYLLETFLKKILKQMEYISKIMEISTLIPLTKM